MVHPLMTRFLSANPFICVSRLTTINILRDKKINYKLHTNASFATSPEKNVGKNLPPSKGGLVTILSLDGGGVKGIIGGVILTTLEKHLQDIDGKNARIAEYFDVIAGTSTGGLMTALLTAPNEEDPPRPLYAAKDIVPFYRAESPAIFYGSLKPSFIRFLEGPKYDGKHLRKRLPEILGEKKLSQTCTYVVIPTYDIKKLQPTIFSSFHVENDPTMDVKLSDICIGTSAAPLFFPPHKFPDNDHHGELSTFNLLDGGVTANDPTLVGMTAMSRRSIDKHPDMDGFGPLDYHKYLVISIGTGSAERKEYYNAKMAAKWGAIGWVYNMEHNTNPLIDIFFQSSADMVQYHTSVLFQALEAEDNYLRIDIDTLGKDEAEMDNAKKENLDHLEVTGAEILRSNVKRMNLDTYEYEPIQRTVTNCEELKKFAKMLSDERKARMKTMESSD